MGMGRINRAAVRSNIKNYFSNTKLNKIEDKNKKPFNFNSNYLLPTF